MVRFQVHGPVLRGTPTSSATAAAGSTFATTANGGV
eukprot:gene18778-13532_t